jgi:hypothetical protein
MSPPTVAASFVLTGATPVVSAGTVLTPAAASLTLTPTTPAISFGTKLHAGFGTAEFWAEYQAALAIVPHKPRTAPHVGYGPYRSEARCLPTLSPFRWQIDRPPLSSVHAIKRDEMALVVAHRYAHNYV